MTDKDYGRPGPVSGRPCCFTLPVGDGLAEHRQVVDHVSAHRVAANAQKDIARAIMQLEIERQAVDRRIEALRQLQSQRVS